MGGNGGIFDLRILRQYSGTQFLVMNDYMIWEEPFGRNHLGHLGRTGRRSPSVFTSVCVRGLFAFVVFVCAHECVHASCTGLHACLPAPSM